MIVPHKKFNRIDKNRVELHIHLDGAGRPETIWELLKQKNQELPGDGSLKDFVDSLRVQEPQTLKEFLAPFYTISAAYVNDLVAIQRIAKEFVEDRAKDAVAYCEARFSPHLLISSEPVNFGQSNGNGCHKEGEDATLATSIENLTGDDVVEAVLKGIKEGEALQCGTKVRLILCCIRGQDEVMWDVLRLCEKYRDKGVVGIDLAGDENHFIYTDRRDDGEIYSDVEKAVFTAAKERNIHRTVHAGEAAGGESVESAVNELHAERIGHGYRTLEMMILPEECKEKNIHFEVCPHSSYYTGTMRNYIDEDGSRRHPVLRFAEQNFSFSISTDDPLLTGTTLDDEYELLRTWGFNEADFTKANLEAAKRSFLPSLEKRDLLFHLHKVYGFS